MNKAERWHRISELFDRVVELPALEREAVLAAECADDPQLRTEVERLLQADERTNPIDHDIAGQASTLLLEGDAHEHEGQQFGPYRIVRLLAQGGMGRVYLAEREGEDFAQTVALKLVGGYGSFDAYTARRRFLDERRILARLQHPNIARLLDGGVGPEAQPWFAMEYVDGAPLTDWCDTHRLDVRQRLNLFAKVCEAVDHAHRFLIVHRDLKPGNVLVDNRGEPKVLDFGIAKLLDEGASERTGSTILMTPDYAAPEQIRGGQISTATDVYALGAVLFEVLTGRKPFCDPLASREAPQASRVATEGVHAGERANARATTPHALRKRLRGDIDRILRTALDPEPVRRYRSAAALAEDLRAVADGRAISLRSDRAYRIGIFLRRHKWETAAAAIAVLGLLGATGWALWQRDQAQKQAVIAKREALSSQQVSDLLISAFDAADPSTRSTVAEPTAKDVLDASASGLGAELSGNPEILARMQLLLGRAYVNLGYDDKAAELLTASVEGSLGNKVNNPAQAADALVLLAAVEMDRANSNRAVDAAQRAAALRKAIGATAAQQIDSLKTMGMTLLGAGRVKEAERALLSAQELIVKTYGDPSIELADSLNNRAEVANNSGNVGLAVDLFRESLIMKDRIGARPQAKYATRGLLGVALRRNGKFTEANALLLQNYSLAPSLYPNDSGRRADLEQRLASSYRDQGDLLRAEAGYKKAIAIEIVASGPESSDTAILMGWLADVLDARGSLDEAETTFRRSHEILKDLPDVRDRTKLRAAAGYQAFLVRRGKSASQDELSSLLARWLADYEGSNGRFTSWDKADAMFLNAERRIAAGLLENIEAALPADDPTLAQPMQVARGHYWLARARQAQGDQSAAIADYARAIRIVDSVAGGESAWAALWRLDYAEQLILAGRKREAQAQLALATPVLKHQMSPHSPALARLSRIRRDGEL